MCARSSELFTYSHCIELCRIPVKPNHFTIHRVINQRSNGTDRAYQASFFVVVIVAVSVWVYYTIQLLRYGLSDKLLFLSRPFQLFKLNFAYFD